MNKALLDTDIVSEIGKARDATVASNAKTYLPSFGHYTLSTVTVMEIVRDLQKTQATSRLNAFLATLQHTEVLPFEQPAAELAGRIAGELERTGRPIGAADTMIAAIAIEQGLELVTGNTFGFSACPGSGVFAHAGELATVATSCPGLNATFTPSSNQSDFAIQPIDTQSVLVKLSPGVELPRVA